MTLPEIIITDYDVVAELLVEGTAYDDWEHAHLKGPFDHIISIVDDEYTDPPGGRFCWEEYQARKLRLAFRDTEYDCWGGTAPRRRQVEQIIAFADGLDGRVLIHCAAGLSRSPGAALVLLATLMLPGEEEAAVAHLLAIKRGMKPHRSLVYYADDILGRSGDLIEAYNAVWGDCYDIPWPDDGGDDPGKDHPATPTAITSVRPPDGPRHVLMTDKSPGIIMPYQETYIRRIRVNAIDPQRARYQTKGSRVCGQTCVATLLDIDIEEAIKLVGKGGGTGATDLRKAFAKRGFEMGDRLHPKHQKPETLYLARVHWPKEEGDTRKTPRTHWILIDHDAAATIYDPGWGFNPHQEGGWPEGSRITSLYELWRDV